MKKNTPKFLIAKNEAAKPGNTYLVHTQEPAFVGELLRFDSLADRNEHIEANLNKEVYLITPTTLLVVLKYLTPGQSIRDKSYLENKIVHWIIANHLNTDSFGK